MNCYDQLITCYSSSSSVHVVQLRCKPLPQKLHPLARNQILTSWCVATPALEYLGGGEFLLSPAGSICSRILCLTGTIVCVVLRGCCSASSLIGAALFAFRLPTAAAAKPGLLSRVFFLDSSLEFVILRRKISNLAKLKKWWLNVFGWKLMYYRWKNEFNNATKSKQQQHKNKNIPNESKFQNDFSDRCKKNINHGDCAFLEWGCFFSSWKKQIRIWQNVHGKFN